MEESTDGDVLGATADVAVPGPANFVFLDIGRTQDQRQRGTTNDEIDEHLREQDEHFKEMEDDLHHLDEEPGGDWLPAASGRTPT